MVYPWLADVGFVNKTGSVVSAVAGGTMSLAVSDNATICLKGASATSASTGTGTTQRGTFTNSTLVNFVVEGTAVPCVVNASLSSAHVVCCEAPPVSTLCGLVNDTASDCATRGAYGPRPLLLLFLSGTHHSL